MREIKFRAWDKDAKVMVYEFSETLDGNCTSGYQGGLGKNGELGVDSPSLPDCVLMQFTGLRDKNGTEIFEGDVLRDDVGDLGIVRFGKLPLDKSGDCVCTYVAFYVEGKGQIGRALDYECMEIGDWMEIIGNIHENPDLLDSAGNHKR